MLGDRLYVQKATVSWYCSEACFFCMKLFCHLQTSMFIMWPLVSMST